MKEKKDIIKVDMIRMEGDVAPFIQVDYMDKNANEHTGLVLLDSASTVNILSPEMADNIGMLCKLEEFCDEYLSHAVDVEGKSNGPEKDLIKELSSYNDNLTLNEVVAVLTDNSVSDSDIFAPVSNFK